MALDVLPIPAASVGVESLFSRAKEVATDRRATIGTTLFEAIECLNHFWKDQIVDLARVNEEHLEEVYLHEFVVFEELEADLATIEKSEADDLISLGL